MWDVKDSDIETITLCVDVNGMKACEAIDVIPIPGVGYRLLSTPMANLDDVAYLGDVVAVERIDEDTFLLVDVIERSDYRHYDWFIGPERLDSPEGQTFLERVAAVGGAWERVSLGMLFVHLPPDADFDLEAEFALMCGRGKGSPPAQ